MHESMLARKLFNEAQEMAFRLGVDRINLLKIRLGVASGIDKDVLRYDLIEHIFPETIAEDAEVEVMLEPLIAKCVHCKKEITQIDAGGGCPFCGSRELDIISGMNVAVEGVE